MPLALDIVEMILIGEEPSGLSLTTLTKQLPSVWEQQQSIHEAISDTMSDLYLPVLVS